MSSSTHASSTPAALLEEDFPYLAPVTFRPVHTSAAPHVTGSLARAAAAAAAPKVAAASSRQQRQSSGAMPAIRRQVWPAAIASNRRIHFGKRQRAGDEDA